jgi:hypothetical protein
MDPERDKEYGKRWHGKWKGTFMIMVIIDLWAIFGNISFIIHFKNMAWHNKLFAPWRCIIEFTNGIHQDYFCMLLFYTPCEKSREVKDSSEEEKISSGEVSFYCICPVFNGWDILWLFRHHFVALCGKWLLSEMNKLM